MGLAINDLIPRTEITLDDLKHKTFAIDSFNLLYQFLTTIRGQDGTLLQDSEGNVTSHLVGLFSRITNLMQKDMKFIFVFDGKPPVLKLEERERRKELKREAEKEYEIAKEREDLDAMKKYASRTATLTSEIIAESKQLVSAFGFPYVEAQGYLMHCIFSRSFHPQTGLYSFVQKSAFLLLGVQKFCFSEGV